MSTHIRYLLVSREKGILVGGKAITKHLNNLLEREFISTLTVGPHRTVKTFEGQNMYTRIVSAFEYVKKRMGIKESLYCWRESKNCSGAKSLYRHHLTISGLQKAHFNPNRTTHNRKIKLIKFVRYGTFLNTVPITNSPSNARTPRAREESGTPFLNREGVRHIPEQPQQPIRIPTTPPPQSPGEPLMPFVTERDDSPWAPLPITNSNTSIFSSTPAFIGDTVNRVNRVNRDE